MRSQAADPRTILAPRAAPTRLLLLLTAAAAVPAGLIAGNLAAAGHITAVFALFIVLVPILAWRRFAIAVGGMAFLAIVIEQFAIGAAGGDVTDRVPLFTSLSSGIGLAGAYVTPFEIVIGVLLAVLLARTGLRQIRLPRSDLALSVALLLVMVAFGAVHGIATGGDSKETLWEIRPFTYVGVMFLLVSQLSPTVRTLWALLWTFVIGVGLKTLQGILLLGVLIETRQTRPDYLLSHEDAVFFSLFILLVAALWLLRMRCRMRALTTAMLPFVFVMNAANNRRTAWLMIGAGVLLLILLTWVRQPDRRPLLAGLVASAAVLSGVYIPLFWNQPDNLLGSPVRSIRSVIQPDPRDAASNLYRQAENANLYVNIKRSPILGTGYGIPIDYRIPIVDISADDPSIKYIPHNGILDVWYRLGAIGALAFWTFIGFAILTACRVVVKANDRRLVVFGAFGACAVVAYLIEGNLDLGLDWFRVAVWMGAVFGSLEIARRVVQRETVKEASSSAAQQAAAVVSGAVVVPAPTSASWSGGHRGTGGVVSPAGKPDRPITAAPEVATIRHFGLSPEEASHRRAAETGSREAAFKLAEALKHRGAREEAERWYRRAAADGDVRAAYNVGVLLEASGDQEEAEKWYRQAAERGHADAAYYLGFLHENAGRLDEAEPWYARATAAGHQAAGRRLRRLLELALESQQ